MKTMPLRETTLAILLAATLAQGPGVALAHDGHRHAPPRARAAETKAAPAATPVATPAPVASTSADLFLGGRIGGDFDLVDQDGRQRRLADFAGRHVLLFFGYANCESICSAAIPLMSQTLDSLGQDRPPVELVMITVDPERDTPEGLRQGLAKYDPRLIGLTGSREKLEAAWKAFSINVALAGSGWNGGEILSHGSFLYLLGPDGKVLTLVPPILAPEQSAKIVRSYLDKSGLPKG